MIDAHIWDALAHRIYNTALVQRPERAFVADLKSVLSQTPPETQLRWSEVLSRRLVSDRGSSRCVGCGCASDINLALDAGETVTCAHCAAETTGPLQLLGSGQLNAMERFQRRGLLPGDTPEVLLTSAFGRLCDVSLHAIIIDRYAIADAVRADGRSAGSSGLQRFLRLADARGVRSVQVHTAEGAKVNNRVVRAADVPTLVRGLAAPLSLQGIEVEVVVQSALIGRKKIHDRTLAFSWAPSGVAAFFLGKGLGQFDGRRVDQDYGWGVKEPGRVMRLASELVASAQLQVRVL